MSSKKNKNEYSRSPIVHKRGWSYFRRPLSCKGNGNDFGVLYARDSRLRVVSITIARSHGLIRIRICFNKGCSTASCLAKCRMKEMKL